MKRLILIAMMMVAVGCKTASESDAKLADASPDDGQPFTIVGTWNPVSVPDECATNGPVVDGFSVAGGGITFSNDTTIKFTTSDQTVTWTDDGMDIQPANLYWLVDVLDNRTVQVTYQNGCTLIFSK